MKKGKLITRISEAIKRIIEEERKLIAKFYNQYEIPDRSDLEAAQTAQ